METANGTEKKFEVIEYQGKPARLYPNGTIRGKHGHIVGQSSERGSDLRKRRNQQGTETAREAIRRATKSETFDEGFAKIVSKRVEVAMTDTGRAGNDAARWLSMVADAYNPTRVLDVQGTVTHKAQAPQLPESYYRALEALAREEGVVIDAQEIIDDAQTNEN